MATVSRTRSKPTRRGAPVAAPATLVDEEERRKSNKKDKETPAVRADHPSTGRNTPLGRKTESPASIKTAGPSGQKGKTQHQKLHANK